MYHGEMTEKLKLLYKLHLPPAVCPEEAESALEATHFFTENEAEEPSFLPAVGSLGKQEVTSGEEDVGNESRKGKPRPLREI
ncbi:TBC1 domain family member 9B-like isoform X2 [Notothenia coriiceps]|uniref:TBC1 domain family member 9B-like isoform X2 n=1 Tax=Notothenia coriiceps TaxID=8208 RepID=A0A6I9PNM4_9TELE|nr:PREDICTED: TBC1 domain family member 9B-like isoform X2 [Notothenia coriiceps]